jgi:hypothetical protein
MNAQEGKPQGVGCGVNLVSNRARVILPIGKKTVVEGNCRLLTRGLWSIPNILLRLASYANVARNGT